MKSTYQNKFHNGSLVLAGLILIGCSLTACNGTNSQSKTQVNETNNSILNGLTYDPVVNAVFSVDQTGILCKLSVNNIPGNMMCNLVAPNNIDITSQVVSDNKGSIYAIGSDLLAATNFILKYQAQNNVWTTASIKLPFIVSRSKLLYFQEKLYISDPNSPTLYTINLKNNIIESIPKFFNPAPGVIEDFDRAGNLYYSYQINQESESLTNTTMQIYTVPIITTGALGTKFGQNNVNINDLTYVNNTAYVCAESNFLYLPAGSNENNSWQILTNNSKNNYFSCDYVTTDEVNLYYVEGQWMNNKDYSNNYIDAISIVNP